MSFKDKLTSVAARLDHVRGRTDLGEEATKTATRTAQWSATRRIVAGSCSTKTPTNLAAEFSSTVAKKVIATFGTDKTEIKHELDCPKGL